MNLEGLLKVDKTVLLLALFLAGFIVYTPALQAPFFWDDYVSIPEVQPYQGIEHTESRPLRVFSFYLDSWLWRGNPGGYHFTNILLNSIAGVLVFLFMQVFLKNQFWSFMISLLFVLHPIHTESVAWIKNRTEMLFLIFFILSFLARKKNLLLSVALFALCALSKESSVIFPVVLTLYIYFFEEEKKYAATLPFYGIAAIRGIYSLVYAEQIVGTGSAGSLFDHFNLVLNTYSFYLGKLLYPVKLLVDWQPQTAFSPVSLLVFTGFAGALFLPKLEKNVRFFLALLFISILPYSNLVYIAGRPLGEQRMFLPSLAFVALLFFAVNSMFKAKALKYAFLSALVLFYSGSTFARAKEWQDPALLWKQAEALYPGSPRIKHNLAGIYYQRGDYARARLYSMQALGVEADAEGAYLLNQNLALISMREGDAETAENMLRTLLEARPDDGAVLYNLGLVSMKLGKHEAAIGYLERARKILPGAIQIFNNLAVSYMNAGKPDKAAQVLREAIAMAPEYSNGVYNLIVIYKKSGKKREALAETEKAMKAFPGNPVFLKLYQELQV